MYFESSCCNLITPHLLALVSLVPVDSLFVCAHCSSVSTVPLFKLFLCAHCFSVPTVRLCPLSVSAHCSSNGRTLAFLNFVLFKNHFFLSLRIFPDVGASVGTDSYVPHCPSVSTVPLCPLFLYVNCLSGDCFSGLSVPLS